MFTELLSEGKATRLFQRKELVMGGGRIEGPIREVHVQNEPSEENF